MIKSNKISVVLVLVLIVLIALPVCVYYFWLNQTDYWGSAPDGAYLVFVSGPTVNGEVFFPLCEDSGGDLHGWWKLAANVTLPSGITQDVDNFCYGYAEATLKDNVIISLENSGEAKP